MGDSSISLQTRLVTDPDKQSLHFLISRINEQRGSFRNVTEESLEEEIKNGIDGGPAVGDGEASESPGEIEVVISKKEEVFKAREEMLKQIGQAQHESVMALDFISLLLSQRNPGSASLTLSPFFKQNLPMGSLGAEVMQTPERAASEKQQDQMVALGWRMQSLSNAADSLLGSASRLEREVNEEATYWDQVLAVKNNGWSVSRLPRQKHTLGVRYGFAEAHSSFRDRGLAALHRDAGGNLNLDNSYKFQGKKRLQVRILKKGRPISTSSRDADEDGKTGSLEQEILAARNSIFDEELHHELHREAQHLANQGVQCIDSAIMLPYEDDERIEVDLRSSDNEEQEAYPAKNVISNAILRALRLLLSQAHNQNLQDRSQPPIPLREGQSQRSVYAILKPIIEVLSHRSHAAATYDLLGNYSKVMAKAGLPMSFGSRPTRNLVKAIPGSAKALKSRMKATLDFVTAMSSIKIVIHILDHADPTIIDITTTNSSPNFGTTYRIRIPESKDSAIVCSSLNDLECEISSILREAIKNYICATIDTWRGAEIGVEVISKYNPVLSRRDTISVDLDQHQLSLSWHANDGTTSRRVWFWRLNDDFEDQAQTLRDILSQIP